MFSLKLTKISSSYIRTKLIIIFSIFIFTLNACNKPPYNDFEKDQPKLKKTGYGTAIGAVIGSVFGATFIGAVVGGSSLTAITLYKTNREAVLKELSKDGIQFIHYGDQYTLVVPTDRYYLFDSSRLNDICYKGLNDIVRLLSFYPKSKVFVAGFTDNVDYPYTNYKLSKARAETMLAFLWAHDIPAEMLKAQGFAERFDIGDNHLIRGSAYNRRIEIQWYETAPEKRGLLPKGFKLDKNEAQAAVYK